MSRAHPAGPRHADVLPESHLGLPSDALEWDPRIWPQGSTRSETGQVQFQGWSVDEIVRQYPTPVMVLSAADLQARARAYVDAFADSGYQPGVQIFYAGKAFLCGAVVQWLSAEGLGIDVCSGGELALALAAGADASQLLFHGNNKSVTELRAAIEAGVGRIVVDSAIELERISEIAEALGVTAPVLIRVTLGVEAHTHEYIATSHEDQKFGFSLASGSALSAVRQAATDPNLQFIGLHSHIGSQIFAPAGFKLAAHRAVALMATIRDELGLLVMELNLGGGMGIAYTSDDQPLDIAHMAPVITRIVTQECAAAGLPTPRLDFEPGRAIVGPSTVTLYTVGTVKDRSLTGGKKRRYISVDGGMSDNIRTALYDAEYTVTLANRSSAAPSVLSRVVGKHCESGDIVVRDVWLPDDIAPGDILAVAATGAYNRAMASNYNMVTRPGVVAIVDGELKVIVKPEQLSDLLALDPYLAPSAGA